MTIAIIDARGPQYVVVSAGAALAGALAEQARIASENAAASAASAQALVGPVYADTTAGLAATASGGFFAVNASGIVTIYQDVAGVAVAQRTLPTSATLAAAGGSALIGFSHSTSYAAGTIGAHLKGFIVATDAPYNAVGDGVTSTASAINAALTAGGALANGADIILPPGTYVCGATGLSVPAKVRLVLNGAKITSSATNAITVAVGNDGATGGIIGSGHTNSIIEHTGTGVGILADGIASQADLHISDIWIKGTSAGAAPMKFARFNRGTTRGVKATGYTAGSAFISEGANCITHFGMEISTCLHGMDLRGTTTGGTFSSNAIIMVGGQITNCTGYGWRESTTGGGGRNLGNRAIGVTFENNGTNASGTTGDVFNQNCDSLTIEGCYFENGAGNVPTNCITIGDGSNGPKGTRIVGNIFTNTNTNTINDVNGQTTFVSDNVQNGANTNFMQHGTLARGLFLGPNRTASTNYFAGSDSGLDSVIVGGSGTYLNQQAPTIRGYGFNVLSGLNQDLVIRSRSGATNSVLFQDSGGTGVASVADNGTINTTAAYQVDGLQVVGNRGAAIANATDAASTQARLNDLLAFLRTWGAITT